MISLNERTYNLALEELGNLQDELADMILDDPRTTEYLFRNLARRIKRAITLLKVHYPQANRG